MVKVANDLILLLFICFTKSTIKILLQSLHKLTFSLLLFYFYHVKECSASDEQINLSEADLTHCFFYLLMSSCCLRALAIAL